jgi:hypothetical protein
MEKIKKKHQIWIATVIINVVHAAAVLFPELFFRWRQRKDYSLTLPRRRRMLPRELRKHAERVSSSPESFDFYPMNFGRRGFMHPTMFLGLIASRQKTVVENPFRACLE